MNPAWLNPEEMSRPDCSVERWWKLAEHYPWHAMRSPYYDLFLLEDPSRWFDLERVCIMRHKWVENSCVYLPIAAQRHLLGDYVEHLLPLYDEFTAMVPGAVVSREYVTQAIACMRQGQPQWKSRLDDLFCRRDGRIATAWKDFKSTSAHTTSMSLMKIVSECCYYNAAVAIDKVVEKARTFAYHAITAGYGKDRELPEYIWQWRQLAAKVVR